MFNPGPAEPAMPLQQSRSRSGLLKKPTDLDLNSVDSDQLASEEAN